MRIVIVGATSAIARHCARLWVVREPCECILVGRDKKRLQAVAQDLQVLNEKTRTALHVLDFHDPKKIARFAKTVCSTGTIDILLIAQGLLGDQKHCQEDLAFCKDVLMLNALSPVLFAEAFAKHMQQGKIVIIGSVAGDRGRATNYTYGAAKGLLERYVEGLQQRFRKSLVQVSLIKPGPTKTPMTEHLTFPSFLFSPVEPVAKGIVQAIDKNRPGMFYVPKRWKWIMGVVCRLPLL